MPFNELDVVRISSALSDKDAYTGAEASVSAGAEGTIVRGKNGDSSYDVEFLQELPGGALKSSILIVPAGQLEPVWSASGRI